ncbi:hypothetical protein HD806DRAFT_65197 [Xylariaceae sp. AK1471]|nr:hypothetical protein HD806DRAFT_65197 [Xylariaceae sp. AK1471]
MSYTSRLKPRFLVPARDSRHRIACLALYRALLRLAPQVSLPDDLATGWGAGKNPIIIHIQRAFRRNVADTSPRIVYPALSTGYRMLSVLHDAALSPPSSQHHASIITFLKSRLVERQRSLANRPPPPSSRKSKSSAPRPGTLPLLVKVSPPPSPSNPDPKPEYAIPHRPRPASELGGSGRRQIPQLDMAGDMPILRLTKPQPRVLNRVITQKLQKRYQRSDEVRRLGNEVLLTANLEDEWERDVARLATEEASASDDFHVSNAIDERLYAYTVHKHGIETLCTILTRERTDQIARADAMRRLIMDEKALAAEEKAQRTAERRARWEAKMLELHGEGWRDLFPKLKDREGSAQGQPE